MKEFNYLVEKKRMTIPKEGICTIDCITCPLAYSNNGKAKPCSVFETLYPHEATEIVRKWASEHPEKTKGDRFKELYPNCQVAPDGTPDICPLALDTNFYCDDSKVCSKCTHDYFSQPYEEGEQ